MTELQADQTMQRGPKNLVVRRIGVLIVDFIALAILGYIVGLIGKDFLVELGTHGVLIGWLISTTYFALFN